MEDQGKINEQLVDALLAHMGLHRHGGRKDNAGALLPLLIMDAHYILFTEKIAPLTFDGVHDSKLRANLLFSRDKWHDAYNAFNKSLFRAWNKEQRDYVCDMMDSFGSAIHNDLMFLQVSATNRMAQLEFKDQQVIAACVACNVLAQYAQKTYGIVFRTRNYGRKHNNHIKDCEDWSYKFETFYYATTLSELDVNLNEDRNFTHFIDDLADKMMTWLKNYN